MKINKCIKRANNKIEKIKTRILLKIRNNICFQKKIIKQKFEKQQKLAIKQKKSIKQKKCNTAKMNNE